MCGGHLWALACPATGPFLLLSSPLFSCEQLPFPHSNCGTHSWSDLRCGHGTLMEPGGLLFSQKVNLGCTQIQKMAGGLGLSGVVSLAHLLARGQAGLFTDGLETFPQKTIQNRHQASSTLPLIQFLLFP